MRPMHRSYLAAAQVLLVGAAFVLQVACGADTTIEGPGLVASADGSAGGDSSVQQQDGGGGQDGLGLTDVAAPSDTVPGVDADNPSPFDGGKPDAGKPDAIKPDAVITEPNLSCVGKCGQAQPNKWPCQCDAECSGFGDCCADYASVCSTVGPGPGPGPNPTPAEIIACLEGACGKSVAQCTSSPTCNKFWGCAKNCDSEKCLQACTSGLDIQALAPILQPLMTCGEQAGCTEGGTTEPPTPGPICGDGKCEQPENSLNCMQDCPNQPAGDVQKCLAAKCSSSYKACFSDPSCVAAVACMNEGNQPQQCVNDQKTEQLLNAMLSCGNKNGCLGATDSCGNGACDNGETAQTCPSDCQVVVPPTDSVTKCLSSLCGKAYNSCAKSSACLASLGCVVAGGSLSSCAKDPATVQVLASLVQCGNQQKCFSGGGSAASCEGKCGQFVPGAACQCNAECKAFGNCCGDWAKLCSTTPGPVCGDGVCSAPGETSITCPSDCGAPPAKSCKSKADCASTEICCGKADGSQVCTLAGQCK